MYKLYKNLSLLFIILTLSFITIGCSKNSSNNSTDEVIKDAEAFISNELNYIKTLDETTYQEYFGEEGTLSLGVITNEYNKKFFQLIVDKLDYKIISSEKTDDNTVNITLDITSLNMEPIMTKYIESVLVFSNSKEVENLSDEELNKKNIELLIAAIDESKAETITTTITVPVKKVNDIWTIEMNDDFVNAIYGNILEVDM